MRTVLLEVADGIATLTLNQPAQRNPMSVRMGEEIAEALYPTADLQEGLAAGRERRPPRFTGR